MGKVASWLKQFARKAISEIVSTIVFVAKILAAVALAEMIIKHLIS